MFQLAYIRATIPPYANAVVASCATLRARPSRKSSRSVTSLPAKRIPRPPDSSINVAKVVSINRRPPRFRIFVNDPSLVTRDYGYWVENELRERFELEGVPVSIDFVKRS